MEPMAEGNGRSWTGVSAVPGFRRPARSRRGVEAPVTLSVGASGFHRAEALRRSLNVLAAAVLLVVTTPLMLVIALLVKISSPGPVFYRQSRVGLDRRNGDQLNGNWRRQVDHGGKLFTILKFRTMYTSAERTGQVWASPDDPRVTPIGSFLRKYRLDELPQLMNVLRGDMNLVGPRPEQPAIFNELRGKIDRYPHRQRVLPGITGWAQVNQHYDSCLEDVQRKVHYDIEYISRRSVVEDLKIMARTVPVVVFRRGAW
jgi:lipopolysaccharide/colanic/teichoic acid biosynthesis glycosyltransferase